MCVNEREWWIMTWSSCEAAGPTGTPGEIAMVKQVLRRVAPGLANGIAASLGYRLVRDGIYSPLPEIPSDEPPDWERKSSRAGIELDTRSQIE